MNLVNDMLTAFVRSQAIRYAFALTTTLAVAVGDASAQEMFSVNLWSTGKTSSPSVWTDTPSNTDTLTLEPGEAAGLFETTAWQNINFGNPFSTSTTFTTINGSAGSTATFNMPNRRNSSPYWWNAVRNDSDTVHLGNATLLDAHAVGTEDPYDQTRFSILQVSNIPFEVYDVVIYLGINNGQRFSGEGTIDFNGSVQQFTMPTTEPDGTLTRIVNPTTPGNYFLFEQQTGDSFSAEIWGDDFTHLGPAGFQIVEIPNPARLKLEVDTVTGDLTLKGDDSDPIDMNYYEVTSAGNSMNPAGWISLADQDYEGNGPPNGSGNGWEEGGGSGAHALAEGYLLGDSTIVSGAAISLGQGYNTAVDAQDLVFRYRTDSGARFDGIVEYVQGNIPGDLDGDGDVDGVDLSQLFAAFTGPGGGPPANLLADLDNDGDVDGVDIALAFGAFTGPLSPANVPEPTSLLLLSIGAAGLFRSKRSRVRTDETIQ